MTCLCVETLTQEDREKAQLVAFSLGYSWASPTSTNFMDRNFKYMFLYSLSPGREYKENRKNMITCSNEFRKISGRTGEPVTKIELKDLYQLSPLSK